MQRDSAAERREKLRYALESWDPSLRRSSGPIVCSPTASPSRPQRIMGARATRDKGDLNDSSLSQHSLSSSAASSSRFDGQLNPADLCSALDEMAREASCHWQKINSFRAKLAPSTGGPDQEKQTQESLPRASWVSHLGDSGLVSTLDFRSALPIAADPGDGVGTKDCSPDVPSQVLIRLLAMLKEKESRWRTEVHRASVLEGENAELRARLAASEDSNCRLRARLHSGVTAFHRTLAQAKEKLDAKEEELGHAKALSVKLKDKVEVRGAEVRQLRRQVSLLHKWCTSAGSPLFAAEDEEGGDRERAVQRGWHAGWAWYDADGYDQIQNSVRGTGGRVEHAAKRWRRNGDAHVSCGAKGIVETMGEIDEDAAEDAGGDWGEDEGEQAHVRKRLQELAALRALRRAIQGRRLDSDRASDDVSTLRATRRQHSGLGGDKEDSLARSMGEGSRGSEAGSAEEEGGAAASAAAAVLLEAAALDASVGEGARDDVEEAEGVEWEGQAAWARTHGGVGAAEEGGKDGDEDGPSSPATRARLALL